LQAAGVTIPCQQDGTPKITVTISPLFALDAEDVPAGIDRVPFLQPGRSYLIE
jgi:hypothetical protein